MAEQQSQIAWAGPSWRLRVTEVARPSGPPQEQGYLEHPGSVVLVPLYRENQVLLIRQYRPTLGRTILELPAGTRGWAEEWLDCAQRELREETGYEATSFTSLGTIWPAPGYSTEQMVLYLATGLDPAPLPADFDEIIELQPTPLAQALVMAREGRLQDAKSIIGILRVAGYLGLF